nr:hypothetical protein [Ardenticatenales bacterium]
STLREFLRHKLPEYMIPARFVFMDAFPLTSSGKIDRHHLPLPQDTQTTVPESQGSSRLVPLSYAQERFYFLSMLEPDCPLYNIFFGLEIRGPLDMTVLARSLEILVLRHDALRTTFHAVEGEPKQRVHSEPWNPLSYVDLSQMSDEAQQDAIAHRIPQEADQLFDLSKQPPLRVVLLRCNSQSHYLFVTVHHIIFDEWSFRIFLDELLTLYQAHRTGSSISLPPHPFQYPGFAIQQRAAFMRADQASLAYWRAALDNLTTLQLPTDYPRPAMNLYQGDMRHYRLAFADIPTLRSLMASENVTLFMVTLAAYVATLRGWVGQDDIVVGTPIANRYDAQTESAIGLYLNTLVLRINASDSPSFMTLLGRVRDTMLDSYEHQDVPFEKLVEMLQPQRDLSRNPLFQVAFTQESALGWSWTVGELHLSRFEANENFTKFDLSLNVAETTEGLLFSLTFDTHLFAGESMEHLLQQLGELMIEVLASPDQPLPTALTLDQPTAPRLLSQPVEGGGAERFAATSPVTQTPTHREMEEALREIWQSVLRVPYVSLHDNFFELGGHSLKAIRVAMSAQEMFGLEVPLKALFLNPTIETLAAHLTGESDGPRKALPPFTRAVERAQYRLSHAQQRLWFIDQFIEEDTSYLCFTSAQMNAEVRHEVFVATWRYLIARHSIMRTVYRMENGYPVAVVLEDVAEAIRIIDLQGLTQEAQELHLQRHAEVEQRTPFDLERGPLIRISLFQRERHRYQMMVNMHHIVTDLWSVELLFEEFSTAYEALLAGATVPLPPVHYEYVDYVQWEKQLETSAYWQAAEQYLLDELSHPLPNVRLPYDFPAPELPIFKGRESQYDLPLDLHEQLRVIARTQGVSMFMLYLTAYSILLRHMTQQDDILIGFPAAGRSVEESKSIVGFLVNTLVIRVRFEEYTNTQTLLQGIRTKCLRALETQHYPFDVLVKKVQPTRQINRLSALLPALFAYEPPGSKAGTGMLQLQIEDAPERSSKFDLSMTIFEEPDRAGLAVTYNTSLFKTSTIDTLAHQFVHILRQMAATL